MSFEPSDRREMAFFGEKINTENTIGDGVRKRGVHGKLPLKDIYIGNKDYKEILEIPTCEESASRLLEIPKSLVPFPLKLLEMPVQHRAPLPSLAQLNTTPSLPLDWV